MKFFHLSDLHIGKQLHGFSLIEDQKYILDQILEMIRERKPDVLLIAGDVYDKSAPSAEAVAVFDGFLTGLAGLENGPAVCIISGNHDSQERLSFGSRLFSSHKIYIAGSTPTREDPEIKKVVFEDEYGKVNIYLLPFFRPYFVREIPGMEDVKTYEETMARLISQAAPDYSERNVLLCHQFFTGNTNHFLEVVLMLLGLRTGEIRGLAFADFNEAERIISIRRQIVRKDEVLYSADGNVSVKRVGVEVKATKTECSNRILRVPPLVFPLLNERRNKLQTMMQTREANGKSWNHLYDSYICVSDDGNIKSEGTLSIALKKICTNGGIPIVTPHDLRHITATMMFQYGINHEIASDTILEHVSKYLGHASTNTTFDVYMDYVGKLSRIRDVSGKVADPFYYPVNGDDGGGI